MADSSQDTSAAVSAVVDQDLPFLRGGANDRIAKKRPDSERPKHYRSIDQHRAKAMTGHIIMVEAQPSERNVHRVV